MNLQESDRTSKLEVRFSRRNSQESTTTTQTSTTDTNISSSCSSPDSSSSDDSSESSSSSESDGRSVEGDARRRLEIAPNKGNYGNDQSCSAEFL